MLLMYTWCSQVRVTPPVSFVNDTKIAHGTQPAFVEEFDVYPRPAASGSEAGALSCLQSYWHVSTRIVPSANLTSF